MAVPLFDPSTPLAPLREELAAAIGRVVEGGAFVLGPEVAAFEQELAAAFGTREAIGVANGTEALTIALRAAGVRPGDDVVVPSFTFYASAEAIPPLGANPVFCDVDPATCLVTPDTVRAALTPRTTAIVAVDLFGNLAPDLRDLGLPVIEDAAQAAGTTGAGTRGTLATLSFYPSKNLGAFGDGGAILTDDAALAERVRTLRFHGSRDKVTYEEVGYNSRLDELQAAVLRVMLPHLPAWAEHRAQARELYLAEGFDLPLPEPAAERVAWHLMVARHPEPDALAARLAERGIQARGYYRRPVHEQPAMAPWPARVPLPGTDELARTHLALPVSAAITRDQVAEVVRACAQAG